MCGAHPIKLIVMWLVPDRVINEIVMWLVPDRVINEIVMWLVPDRVINEIVMWRVPDRVINAKSRKDRKIIRVDKKQFFLKEKQPTYVFCLLIRFFCFFLKRKRFSLLKKTQKPHSVLFTLHHAISPSAKLHNINLL